MEITFLGTGTSQGVPVIACPCEVCHSTDSKDKRLRTSVMIETKGSIFVIDSGPDFRQQMLRENVTKLDAILFTHQHKDHIAGLDDVRAFNYVQKKPMDVYGDERVIEAVKKEFAYSFSSEKYPGVPDINLHTIANSEFYINQIKITPVLVMHLRLPIFAYRIGDVSYITDANYISEPEKEKLKGSKILIVNALRRKKHISHFNLEEALELIKELKPEQAYLTHLSHQIGNHVELSKEIPENVFIAYDRLKLKI